jgi:hypothetical protein
MRCILLLFAITSSFATSIPGTAPDGADEVITPSKGPSRLELKRACCVLPRPSRACSSCIARTNQANECLRGGINREPTSRGQEHLEELVARVRTLLSEVQQREEDDLTDRSPHTDLVCRRSDSCTWIGHNARQSKEWHECPASQ